MKFVVPWSVHPELGDESLPLLDLFLRRCDGHFERCPFLIDSGADMTMAPARLAIMLEMDWRTGDPVPVRGVSPKEECVVEGRILWVEVHILEAQSRLRLPICFAEGNVPFLLGRQVFFDAFRIQFDQPGRVTNFELIE